MLRPHDQPPRRMPTPPVPDPADLYRVLAESAPDAILTIDEASTLLSVNPAAERVFGYPAAELVGRPLAVLMPERLRGAHAAAMGRYLATGVKRIAWQAVRVPMVTRAGLEFPVEISFGEFVTGGRRLFAGFVRDVSDRVAAERALEGARADAEARAQEAERLADELQEQALELEQQTEEAQALAEELEEATEALDARTREAEAARADAERTLAQLRAIERVTDAALSQGSYDEVFAELLRRVRAALGTDTATVLVLAPAGDELVVRASDGLGAVVEARSRVAMGRGVAGRVAASGAPLVVEDLATADVAADVVSPVLRAHVRSLAAVPLVLAGRVVGVLHTGSRARRAFAAAEVRFLALVADRMAGALERSRLYEAAAESEARYRRMFERSPVPMWVYGCDTLRFLAVNPAAVARYGYTEAEFRAMTIRDIRPPDAAPALDAALAGIHARRGGADDAGTFRHRTKAGEVFEVAITAQDTEDAGRAARVVVAVDVSERARAEDAARFLATAGETLAAAALDYEAMLRALAAVSVPFLADYCLIDLLETGPGGRPAVRRVASGHADPAKSDLMREALAFAPDPARAEHPVVRVLRSGAPALIDMDGADRAEEAAAALSDAHRDLLRRLAPRALLIVPLTARGHTLGAMTFGATAAGRAYGAADLALAAELARRAALAIDNARLYAEAQAASRAKSEFLAVMSHELRTPLNAIGGYAELMEMGLRGPVTDQQREDLARVRRAQRQLLGVIDDVLDVARLESGQVTYAAEPVRLQALLADLGPLIEPQAGAKGVTYACGRCPPAVVARADAGKVRQAVLNLLSNAVKFTPRGGSVRLACAANGGTVTVSVTDTGVGIAADQLEAAFRPFVQLDQGLTRAAGGTGLGLALSREWARGMGGDLEAESTPGAGSTFTLTLPSAGAP